MKKLLTFLLVGGAIFCLKTANVQAAAPSLSLSNTGDGDNVTVTVSGDINSSVILYYMATDGTNHLQYIGTTNASGYFSGTVSTSYYKITPSSPVQVKINNVSSANVNWPYSTVAGTGAITLSNTGLIMTVGNSNTITINNAGSSKLYLLNNSNPQIANVNLSGTQATIFANTFGQTVATICVLGTTSNCASAYITVQNSGAQALTLSQSNITIAYSQSAQITILNSTGIYTILNNSNPNVITPSIKDQTITLVASSNGGTAAITVCSTDMSACGIINASVGSISSSALSFSQSAPSLSIGQSLSITLSGGGSSYNISSNSNPNVVNAYIANNSLSLVGSSAGSSVITVCSSNGNCNSLTATVSYAASGGAITLSQSSLWLQVGQAVSVVISGGTAPYSFVNDTNSATFFQTSLNNNILTLTGTQAGSATLSVCSAGGACTSLSVLVNGVSTNTQLSFGSNNLSLKVGATSDVTLYGSGGYYISSTNNQNVATFVINGSKITVTAVSAGSANVNVCQTGGQCGVIYVSVTTTDNASPIVFGASNPTISVGQSLPVALSGGSGNIYYISSNTNQSIVQANISSTNLVLLGLNSGSAVITVCSATNSCNSLAVTVNTIVPVVPTTPTTPTTPTDNLNNNNSNVGSINEGLLFSTDNISAILNSIGANKNATAEATVKAKNLTPLIKSYKLTAAQINTLNYFLVYGSIGTFKLSATDRAGYLASYIQAYAQAPKTEANWNDLLSIAVGNIPAVHSVKAENQAKIEFKKVYKRNANVNNAADNRAIMYIAYGIKISARNLANEAKAIKTFQSVYSHAPVNTLAWNIVKAIAYSGVVK
jgi:ferredoxin